MSVANTVIHMPYVPLIEYNTPETPSDPETESNPVRNYAADLMFHRMIGFTPKQGVDCAVVCCLCVACTLSTLAIAFFAVGGTLVNNPDEGTKSMGTGLLVVGGVFMAICVTKCCVITRCFTQISTRR